jgi:RNA polymerase sigma-70 factor (ECF subfamily)
MLGSVHDADDMVQETLVRAWQGYRRFEARSSLRHWLYRIATNVCLNALARNANRRHLLPQALGASTTRMPEGRPAGELPWLEPFPDTGLENVADQSPAPDARYAVRESVRLAFVAAIQHLPAKQRAVLLLRDVLGWSARETATALKLTVASVTSALQRARDTLAARFPEGRPEPDSPASPAESRLIQRYVDAWESADLPGLVNLLRETPRWRCHRGPNGIAGGPRSVAFWAGPLIGLGRAETARPFGL